MEIETPQEFFEITLPNRFKPEKAKNIDITIQITLTGSNNSNWVITIKDQKIQSVKGTTVESTFTLEASENNFLDLVNDRISVEKAFFSGKINFKGDITAALKLKDTGFF